MGDSVIYSRRVRFSDIDCQGHVFNANYFVYFDDAITDLMDAMGLGPTEMSRQGHDMVLARAECDFRSSAALGEEISTRAAVERIGNTSVVFSLRIEENASGRLVAEGREIYVIIDAASGKPAPVPAYVREAFSNDKG